MPENLQQRLEQSTSGIPMVNPDEQRKYLGTFRERCYLSMTIAQMKQKKLQEAFSRLSLNYPKTSILINGCLSPLIQSTYIQIAAKNQIPFTIVTTNLNCDHDQIGLLIVANEAVNQEEIDIEKQLTPLKDKPSITLSKERSPEQKKSFWKKLF